jgi:VCBS repeat-containing protein
MATLDYLDQTGSVSPGFAGVPGYYGQTFVAAGSNLSSIEFGYNLLSGTGTQADFSLIIAKYTINAGGRFNPTQIVWQSPLVTYRDTVEGFETIKVGTGGVSLDPNGNYVLLINSNAGSIRNDLGAVQASGGGDNAFAEGYFVFSHDSRGTTARDFAGRWFTDQTGETFGDLAFRMVFAERPPNTPPTATGDAVSLDENATSSNLWTTLLSNDTDADPGDSKTIVAVGKSATSGSVIFDAATQSLRYVASGFDSLKAGAVATDTFTYTMQDGAGAQSTATVTVTITGQNDGPAATGISANANEDGPAVVLVAQFADPDQGDAHTLAVDTAGTKGLVTNNGDGTFSYSANGAFESLKAGASATDTFTYTVTDASGATSTATASVTITGQNDGPVAKADTLTLDEGATIENLGAALLSNDIDPDTGDTKSIVSVDTSLTRGSLVFDAATQSLRYVADADAFDLLKVNETATDTFTYTMQDAAGVRSTASVSVTIKGVADGRTVNGTNRPDLINEFYPNGTTSGEDVVYAGNGEDTVYGLGGADILYGANGNDALFGDDGIDWLYGESGDDRLDGGSGDDLLVGGRGNDRMTGGTGRDTFAYRSSNGEVSGSDLITDFTLNDRIDVDPVTSVRILSAGTDTTGDGVADTVLKIGQASVVLSGFTGWSNDLLV